MSDKKQLNRRSFFRRIAGGAVLGGAMMSIISTGTASATDNDPTDPAGVTDRDSNDRPGHGRGITDTDSSDRPGHGRSATDHDSNDAPGHGRGGH
jgi:hypothetical protein